MCRHGICSALATLPTPEPSMGSKVQGEGDYESARRYDEDTKRFVDEQRKAGKDFKGSAKDASAKLTPAEKEALSHAKGTAQDKRDADLLRDMEKKHQTKP